MKIYEVLVKIIKDNINNDRLFEAYKTLKQPLVAEAITYRCDRNRELIIGRYLKVFELQTEGFYCFISVVEIVGRGIYRRRTLSRFTLPTRVLDLYYLYDLFRAMFCFRNELAASLNIIQKLKIAKARKLKIDDPVGDYMLRVPPS
ncbi:35276_t:CDS:2 [Racocetra persica]|uniref:35276_t:CDS:1 n=1 Tax=Racocetra persica TaxID=160502 RepID=A0ACA9LV11_9GLOM|nr:35276_t:CDS:2 [Racocetra persica]